MPKSVPDVVVRDAYAPPPLFLVLEASEHRDLWAYQWHINPKVRTYSCSLAAYVS